MLIRTAPRPTAQQSQQLQQLQTRTREIEATVRRVSATAQQASADAQRAVRRIRRFSDEDKRVRFQQTLTDLCDKGCISEKSVQPLLQALLLLSDQDATKLLDSLATRPGKSSGADDAAQTAAVASYYERFAEDLGRVGVTREAMVNAFKKQRQLDPTATASAFLAGGRRTK